MTCGAMRAIDGRPPLVCELEAGHVGRHALLGAAGPFTWWDEVRPEVGDHAMRETWASGWRKPHVRRAYVSPSQASSRVGR